MQIKVTARHFELTSENRTKAEKALEGLSRYFDNIISAEIILSQEGHRRQAEVHVSVYNQMITGSAEKDDLIQSIDTAVDRAKAQLKKYKEKLRERKPEEITELTQNTTRPETDVDTIE